MDIVAQRPGQVLLAETGAKDMDEGRIFDLSSGRLFSPMPVGSILRRGYWEPPSLSEDERSSILEQAAAAA